MKTSREVNCCHCGKPLNELKFIADKKIFCQNCYLSYQNISSTKSTSFNRQELLSRNRVHIDDPLAMTNLKKIINNQLRKIYNPLKQKLAIICIGTDRSTGDSLGPLTGSKLSNFKLNNNLNVFGTLNSPIHATNLNDKLEFIEQKHPDSFIIAIDAGLGKSSSVGSICVNEGPLKPGSGVDKKLPEVGDMHITGLVNVSGYMEYFVLQSTRLSLVVKMAKIISYSLIQGVRKFNQ
ncbi:spore protease YyaC [Natroniella sulfidigena]|uniref:spore protease YyaC n=1 Tax=Natroniella sulfidigena TaxID=723921 RepID=UPI00200B9C90|nr:spore protease YyaC [Natroniella sulfidigena]MCK8816637.1 spore protease YyaC [Natroniella sulfidigena]